MIFCNDNIDLTDPGDALQREGAQHAHPAAHQHGGQLHGSGEGRTRSDSDRDPAGGWSRL